MRTATECKQSPASQLRISVGSGTSTVAIFADFLSAAAQDCGSGKLWTLWLVFFFIAAVKELVACLVFLPPCS